MPKAVLTAEKAFQKAVDALERASDPTSPSPSVWEIDVARGWRELAVALAETGF